MKNTNSSEAFFLWRSRCLSLSILPKEMEMRKMQFCPHRASNLKEEQSRYHSGVSPAPSCILPGFYGSIEDDPLLFFKGFICVIFNYTYMSVYMCKWGQVPAESRGHRSPRVGDSGSCELPSWVLQTYLRSPEWTEPSLQRGPHPTFLACGSSVRLDIVLPLFTARTPKVPTVLGYSKLRTFLVCVCVCFI